MTRRVAIVLTLVASLCLVLAAGASASLPRLHPQPRIHKASAPAPVIKSVSPLNAKVGDKLTIVGRNFRDRSKTKVFFMRKGGGVTTAKPSSATKTKLVVKIPESVTPLLGSAGGTRFQLRVLTTQFGDPTKLSKSPVIAARPGDGGDGTGTGTGDTGYGAGDCDHDGVKNRDETDDDGDLIPDAVELGTTKTDECKADTDGDGVSDGYEWQAAKDLNDVTGIGGASAPLPYPGKRPWPNPLDASDAQVDHDGDGLTMAEEYKLFKVYGRDKLPLNYSDGKQASQNVAPAGWSDPARWYMVMRNDGRWTDDELDADGDGIGNWDEQHGRMLRSWWTAAYDKEHPYPDPVNGGELAYPGVDMADPDTDGDGVKDGADDQDHDGLSNAFELQRAPFWQFTYVSVGPLAGHSGVVTLEEQNIIDQYTFPGFSIHEQNIWARTNPYNPCKPVYSQNCHLHWPFKYYADDEDWMGVDPRSYNPPPAAPWLYQGET